MNKYQDSLDTISKRLIQQLNDSAILIERTELEILQELVDRYSESLKLLDWVHQEMYPLVTLLEKSSNIGRSVAIKIKEFKRKIDWSESTTDSAHNELDNIFADDLEMLERLKIKK